MLNNLFGSKKNTKQPETKDKSFQAIQEIEKKVKDMEEKIDHLDRKMAGLTEQAKAKLKAGDKNGAKSCLAKKKRYVEQIKQFEGAINMMEEQRMMLDSAESMRTVFETIKKTNVQIVEANKGMTIEDLENLREQMDVSYFKDNN
jgi:phage shock protein A